MENNADSVLILGTVAYDKIETPLASQDFILGGSASFAALACAFFTKAKIVCVIGKDFKDSDMDRLAKRGIDVSGIHLDKTLPTFYWHGKYHENFKSRETIDVRLGAFENYMPELGSRLKDSKFVLLGNISPRHQSHLLSQVRNPSFVVLDTMDLWITTANAELKDLIKKVDLLILNDDEAKQLTNENNLIMAGEGLMAMGAKSVIIKKGEHGSMLFHKDGFFTTVAYPIKSLYDPTGAGDSFAGSLIGHMAKNNDTSFEAIKKAMLYATACASLTVESFSCDKLEASGIEEIERRVEYLKKITTV